MGNIYKRDRLMYYEKEKMGRYIRMESDSANQIKQQHRKVEKEESYM